MRATSIVGACGILLLAALAHEPELGFESCPAPGAAFSPGFGGCGARELAAPPGPVPPSPFTRCAPSDVESDAVQRRARTWLCLELQSLVPASSSSGARGASQRAVFDPVADSLVEIRVAGSFDYMTLLSGGNRTLLVASSLSASTSSSSQRGALSGGSKFYLSGEVVFPVHNVIVSVVGGQVALVSFEEGCALCGGSPLTGRCTLNSPDAAAHQVSCWVPRSECVDLDTSAGGGSSCDLSVWVSWQGTGADGAPFVSASRRLSRFAIGGVLGSKELWRAVTRA
jgi:hypothetical protein